MMIRFAFFGAFFVAFALAEPAWGAGGCGVGCSSTSEGACVRDGWQQGLPVRNVCPASRLTPPCGPYHRRHLQATVGEIVRTAKICRPRSATGTELFCNGSDACNPLCQSEGWGGIVLTTARDQ